MKRLTALLTALALTALAFLPTASHSQGRRKDVAAPPPAKFQRAERNGILNQYVVLLDEGHAAREGVEHLAHALAGAHGGRVRFTYQYALKGFSVELPEAAAVALSKDPRVRAVYQNLRGTVADTQPNPPYHLDRIDERQRQLNQQYNYNATGAGVQVFVLDTGIRTTHQDFGGRASFAADFINEGCQDCNQHGTHVAGTVGGNFYGVAKQATLRAVKVCDANGSCDADVTAQGVDFVTGQKINNPSVPMAANISLIFGPYFPLDQAVRNSIAQGVTYAIAAGNFADIATNYSPQAVGEALVVGASDFFDQRASFSNIGGGLDLFAPGVGIRSAGNQFDTQEKELSGTSMAAPQVAGAAALYLQGRSDRTSTSPDIVGQMIKSNATLDVVGDARSPNRLLYTLFAPAPANPIDNQRFFVWQHYRDFLLREPDHPGLGFWTGIIEQCGGDAACLNTERVHVSYAFMVSTEYQARTDVNLENLTFGTHEYNKEFIRLCYMTYLSRCVDESDGGFQFWLNDLDGRRINRPGNVEQDYKDMVNAFLSSGEYRLRFHGNVTPPQSGAQCFVGCDPFERQSCLQFGGVWDESSCLCDFSGGGGCGPGVIC
ncbi:MAG: S8 family peptidase [Acidobacteria bacterium]|nr:S8 family peptidase [Acidobacteriota bacterium]